MNSVKLVTELGVRINRYSAQIDNQEWCWTTDDDEGLKLAIAIEKLKAQKEL